MDINNIALVRSTNIIPFDGIVKPISNVPYLCKNISSEFSFGISDLLHSMEIIPPLDDSKMFEEDYYDNMVALSSKILKEYLPYSSDYNSMVLFSINGICPDDNEHGFANNTFSNKNVAIIEPLSEHIEQVISLEPTDTALKGDVVLSNVAIVLVRKNIYDLLSEEEKQKLNSNKFVVKTFEGSLKDVINLELENSGRYIPEKLSLSRSTGGFIHSDTSDMQIECINTIANNYNIPQIKYFNLITSRDVTMPKYNEVCNEYNNSLTVQNYYIQQFLIEFLTYINAPIDMINKVSENINYKYFIQEVIEQIRKIGIDNYKHFVDDYNKRLEEQQKNMTLPTPENIISVGMKEKFKNV